MRRLFPRPVDARLGRPRRCPVLGREAVEPGRHAARCAQAGRVRLESGRGPTARSSVVVSLTNSAATCIATAWRSGTPPSAPASPGTRRPLASSPSCRKTRTTTRQVQQRAHALPAAAHLGRVALHAGGLPGYPESHGCVHLPSKLPRKLFGASHMGMTVVVVDNRPRPPTSCIPPRSRGGRQHRRGGDPGPPAAGEKWRWQPRGPAEGPVSI